MKKNRIGKKCNEGGKIKKKLSSNNISSAVPVVNPDNEIRRLKKAAQKKAAQKKAKKNNFKKNEIIKRVYNEIPMNIEDIYTFGYMHDSKSIWKEYDNIGFGGKLILLSDNIEYIITNH